MILATLLIAAGGLLGQPAPGSLQIATEGLIQLVSPPTPPTPNGGGGGIGGGGTRGKHSASNKSFHKQPAQQIIIRDDDEILSVIQSFLDASQTANNKSVRKQPTQEIIIRDDDEILTVIQRLLDKIDP